MSLIRYRVRLMTASRRRASPRAFPRRAWERDSPYRVPTLCVGTSLTEPRSHALRGNGSPHAPRAGSTLVRDSHPDDQGAFPAFNPRRGASPPCVPTQSVGTRGGGTSGRVGQARLCGRRPTNAGSELPFGEMSVRCPPFIRPSSQPAGSGCQSATSARRRSDTLGGQTLTSHLRHYP